MRKSNLMTVVKNSGILYCILFTLTTLADNIWQLLKGQKADFNYHIINRAVIILIAVVTITLFDKFKLRNKILSNLVSYVISMGLVFIYVWITGFFDPLSPGAYQGIFITYTALTIIVSLIIELKNRIKVKNSTR